MGNKAKVTVKDSKNEFINIFSKGNIVKCAGIIVMVSTNTSNIADSFSGTVLFTSEKSTYIVGDHFTGWYKAQFSQFTGKIEIEI